MTPKEIEEQTFRNTVEFHKDELIRLLDGELATDIFTESHHIRLKKYGVIRRVPNRKYTKPTPRAKKILKELTSRPDER